MRTGKTAHHLAGMPRHVKLVLAKLERIVSGGLHVFGVRKKIVVASLACRDVERGGRTILPRRHVRVSSVTPTDRLWAYDLGPASETALAGVACG